jgi:hypothetical protein
MDRNAQSVLHQRCRRIQRHARSTPAVEFFNRLSSPQLLEITEALLPEHRERLYPPTVTLAMFIRQVLDADASCQKAVNGWAAQRVADGLHVCSVRTGGYCRARQRLPLEMVHTLTRHSASLLGQQAPATWHWRGRAVKLVDGTELSMPDTIANQAVYPQPSTQAPGVGFPLMRLVALICLSSGAVLNAAIGPHSGKGTGELSLVRSLLESFEPGDVMLADALYCTYFLIATLMQKGVDVLFEQNGARITNFERGQQLGQRDHIVNWPKPKARPQWMTAQQYESYPDEIKLREVKACGRILVSTLLDHRQHSKSDLSQMYARRWNVELDLRNLKSTMGMDVLRCQTPQMNEKQLWVQLLAYNLIRMLMAQAACHAGVNPRHLSFKHTVQLCTQWLARSLSSVRDHQYLLTFTTVRLKTEQNQLVNGVIRFRLGVIGLQGA